MSGDVQPRKRNKDKKKKKDEPSLPPFVYEKEPPVIVASTNNGGSSGNGGASAEEQIHVYKESRLGGNICAKIIFFLLLATLAVMVGLIITEHRGSSEVATAPDSPWSQMLEGWIDDSPPDKHDDEHDAALEHDDHDEHDEDDEHADHDEEDDHHGEEDEEEHEDDEETAVHEQEQQARSARSVASEPQVSEEEDEDENNDLEDDGAKEEEDGNEEEGDQEEGDQLGENEDDENNEDDNGDPEDDDQDQPQSAEEQEGNEEDDQGENEISAEEDFLFREIPGVTASTEITEDTDDDIAQGNIDQDEEDDINESTGQGSDAGYYSDNQDDNDDDNNGSDDNDDNDDDNNDGDDENDDDENDDDDDSNVEDRNDFDLNNEDDLDNNQEANDEDNDNSIENDNTDDNDNSADNEIEDFDSAEKESDRDFSQRGDQSVNDFDNNDDEEEEADEQEDNEVEHADDVRNVDDYEEVIAEHTFESLDASPITDEDDVSTEQQLESDDDFEEILDAAEPPEPEKSQEESEPLEPIGLALKFGVGIAIIIVAHVVLVRKWNQSDETGAAALQPTSQSMAVPRRQTLIPPSVDSSNLIPEPDDEEYSDEEFDEDEEEDPLQTKIVREALVRKYGKLSPEGSAEEEDVDEEEEEEMDDEDVEDEDEDPEQEFDKQYGYKIATVPSKHLNQLGGDDDENEEDEDEEAGEEEEDEELEDEEDEEYNQRSLDPWKNINQAQQDSEPEISDGEEISGSEDEKAPVLRRTGGPKEADVDSIWPMGPDYPSEPAPVQSSNREDSNFAAVEAQLEENPQTALQQVKSLLAHTPEAVELLSLEARALDKLAEQKHSNKLLEEAIRAYLSLLQRNNINDQLFLKTADRCINRMRFRGQHGQAIAVHKMLITRFPKDPKHRNDLAVTYLMVGRVPSAKLLIEETLQLWPSNGFALVHYGFILKTSENNNQEGSHFMQAGIDTNEPGTMDARFLFHLGDAYNRIGSHTQAEKVYELGVERGLFRSKLQRSLYNVDRLTARPWWTLEQTTYARELRKFEEHWKEIRDEGMAILRSHSAASGFKDETENLRDKGVWKQLELYARGQQISSNCKRAPVTCQLISQFPAAHGCRRGQAKFSVMQPDTHVWPHCGPTNCRLRAHLGLVVPPGTELRVGLEKRSWQEGKMFVFDDSFEHEVWHNGSSMRLVLIVDVWHPELTERERRSLPSI